MNDQSLVRERLHSGHLRRRAWRGADDEVRLEAHAIDLNALSLDTGDDFAHGGVLGAGVLDVVVVEDELDVGTDRFGGGGGEFEGQRNVLRPDVLVEHVVSVCAFVTASMLADGED